MSLVGEWVFWDVVLGVSIPIEDDGNELNLLMLMISYFFLNNFL